MTLSLYHCVGNVMINYQNYGRLWRVYVLSIFRYGTPKKLWNSVRTEYAYRKRHINVTTPPYVLAVEPLYYCNLSCPLCQRQTLGETRKKDAGKLPLAVYDKILDEIGDSLWQCHIFGLGEPLIDWPLTQQIIEKAHQRRIFTLVSTNCTLVTPQIAREIVASGLDHLVCAIDGISQESYEQYRVGGKVEDAIAGMKLIAEEKQKQKSTIMIEWQYLVSAYTEGEMEEARRLASELGVFLRFAPMGGMEWEPELQEQWLPKDSAWRVSDVEAGNPRNSYHCYWLWRGVVINSNGQIGRCPGYQNVAQLGSAADNTIMSIYNGPQSQRARQLFSKGAVPEGDFPNPCNTCSFYTRERGGPYLSQLDSAKEKTNQFVPPPAFIRLDAMQTHTQTHSVEISSSDK